MPLRIILVLTLLPVQAVLAQFSAVTRYAFRGGQYDWFDLVLTAENLDRLVLEENPSGLSHADMVRRFPDDFLITTTSFSAGCQPLGLFIRDRQKTQDVNTQTSGNGNFFLQPNGAFLQMPDQVKLAETSELSNPGPVRNGFQSGPMLVLQRRPSPGLNPASTNLNFRSGMGTYRGSDGRTHLVFAVSRSPVTFHQLALLFSEALHCEQALALTSANCAMTLPFQNEGGPAAQKTNSCCGYLRFQVPK